MHSPSSSFSIYIVLRVIFGAKRLFSDPKGKVIAVRKLVVE